MKTTIWGETLGNGNLKIKVVYKGGLYKEDFVAIEGELKNKKTEGRKCVYQLVNGQRILRFDEQYKNGVKDGQCFYYTEAGKIDHSSTYSEGKLNGLYIRFWDGDMNRPSTLIEYTNDKYDGLIIKYGKRGQIGEIQYYGKGKRWLNIFMGYPVVRETLDLLLADESKYPEEFKKQWLAQFYCAEATAPLNPTIPNIEEPATEEVSAPAPEEEQTVVPDPVQTGDKNADNSNGELRSDPSVAG